MKKFWPKILIPLILLSIFLAPVSPSLKIREGHLTAKFIAEKALAQQTGAQLTLSTDEITDTSAKIIATISNPNQYDFTGKSIFIRLYDNENVYQSSPIEVEEAEGLDKSVSQSKTVEFSGLKKGMSYWVIARLVYTGGSIVSTNVAFFIAGGAGSQTSTSYAQGGEKSIGGYFNNCSDASGWATAGCWIAVILYTGLFEPMALFARLAAHILDFFIYYSTNSDSYSGTFVGTAWGAVRDIANIFFIIALLYVAIQTILGLGSGGKKLIASIIIVALLINFSLFFTQVIIDGSNILAKVFYNNITSQDKNGDKIINLGDEKSVSVALVRSFNPQEVIASADFKNNIGTFIFITMLAIALMVFMVFMFLSVAFLFVGRVVALWLAMIFAPIAFASYTVPFDIPGFGHKKWWENLLKNAFLAPIFIFFLYVIVLFGDALKGIVYDVGSSPDYLDKAMKTIIPFAIVFFLLHKAKKLAVEYSGDIGEALSKAGGALGGLAAGGAIGYFGALGRGTIGRGAAAIAESGWAKKWEAFGLGGTQFRKTMEGIGGLSFDARAGLKMAGVKGAENLGKVQEGGFIKARADKVKERQERARSLEVGEDEGLKQNLNMRESQMQQLLRTNSHEIEQLDKFIKQAENYKKDSFEKLRTMKHGEGATQAENDAYEAQRTEAEQKATTVEDMRLERKALKDGESSYARKRKLETGESATVDFKNNLTADGLSINALEDRVIPEAHHKLEVESRNRKWRYAKTISGPLNKMYNTFIAPNGFDYSWSGADEAAHKIRMEAKLDTGEKH